MGVRVVAAAKMKMSGTESAAALSVRATAIVRKTKCGDSSEWRDGLGVCRLVSARKSICSWRVCLMCGEGEREGVWRRARRD